MENLSSNQIKNILYSYINDRISVKRLAKEYNISVNKVLKILRSNEVTIRKKVFTENEKNEIVKKYNNGESSYKLAKEYDVSKQAILYILRKNKVKMREAGSPRKVPIKDIPIIIERYGNGELCTDIAKTYNCNGNQIRRILHRNGIKVRRFIPRSQEKLRKYTLNTDYFSYVNDSKKNYWAGFILADAYIGNNRLSIKLKREDKEHLGKFLEDIEANYEIKDISVEHDFGKGLKEYEQSVISIFSKEICESLRKFFNLNTTAKSKVICYPLHLSEEFQRDFIRGVLDGDGNIQYYSPANCKVVFFGTKSICEGIKKCVMKYCGVSDLEVKQRKDNLYAIKWSGRKQMLRILDWLYKDADVYLQRKYKQYLDIPKGELKDIVDISEKYSFKEIREKRELLELTRRELAKKVGCSISYINAIENGYRTKVQSKIADELINTLKLFN